MEIDENGYSQGERLSKFTKYKMFERNRVEWAARATKNVFWIMR